MTAGAARTGTGLEPLVAPAPPCEPDTGRGRPPDTGLRGPRSRQLVSAGCPPTSNRDADLDHSAIAFAETALRMVLEVVDRRRPVTQLSGYLGESAIASVLARGRARPAGSSITTARIHRIRLQWAAPGVAEIFGTYERGGRRHAFAGRLETGPAQTAARRGSSSPSICAAQPARRLRRRAVPDWTITALRLG